MMTSDMDVNRFRDPTGGGIRPVAVLDVCRADDRTDGVRYVAFVDELAGLAGFTRRVVSENVV